MGHRRCAEAIIVKNINWALVGSTLAAIAGVVGVILTPTIGATLAGDVKVVLLAISGLILAIPVHHVASVAAARAKAKPAA